MIYYLYDGSFSGLLTSIYNAFYSEKKPDNILKKSSYKRRLFEKIIEIDNDETKADKVAKAIKNKISKRSYKNIYYSYLSEKRNIEMDIYYYLK
ncbi:MAG: TIGR03915 family putative DNA repair protein, partial [Bacillota bacterium]